MVGRVSLGSHRHIREQRHGSHRDGEAKHLILQFEVVSWSKPHHLSTFFCDFSLVKGPQIISMSNTKCGCFFFPIKKDLGRSSYKKRRSHLFFRKAFRTTGEKQEKKHITQKSSQCPIHWGPNPDPLFRLGCRHPSISLQGLWSTRDLNLGVEKIITRPPHDR